MQKTTNEDWWYTDVLGNDQLNKNYIMKLVSASVIQDNSRFWAYENVTMDIVLVVLELSLNWKLIVICDLSDRLLIRPCLKALIFFSTENRKLLREKKVLKY